MSHCVKSHRLGFKFTDLIHFVVRMAKAYGVKVQNIVKFSDSVLQFTSDRYVSIPAQERKLLILIFLQIIVTIYSTTKIRARKLHSVELCYFTKVFATKIS